MRPTSAYRPLSKRTRFQIFDRDGFTCQYCGCRPPDVILEVDHVDPRANGGSNDPTNLVTSCADCNRGKSDRKLGSTPPRPDADKDYLCSQQEIVEAARFLEARRAMDAVRDAVVTRLEEDWLLLVNGWKPYRDNFVNWFETYGAEMCFAAIKACARKSKTSRFSGDAGPRYMSAVLRNMAAEQDGEK